MCASLIQSAAARWRDLAGEAKRGEEISDEALLLALRETHRAFCQMEGMEQIPREACRALMLMDEFTYYAIIGDENYLGGLCPFLCRLNYALKTKFFRGEYESEFFLAPTPEEEKHYRLDLEQISLDAFSRLLWKEGIEDYNGIKLAPSVGSERGL